MSDHEQPDAIDGITRRIEQARRDERARVLRELDAKLADLHHDVGLHSRAVERARTVAASLLAAEGEGGGTDSETSAGVKNPVETPPAPAPVGETGGYEIDIKHGALWQVLDIPGLVRIDYRPRFRPEVATLTFESAPGCEPAGLEFVAAEVQRMTDGRVVAAREVAAPSVGETRGGELPQNPTPIQWASAPVADRVRDAIHNLIGHAMGGTLNDLVEAAVIGMAEAGLIARLDLADKTDAHHRGLVEFEEETVGWFYDYARKLDPAAMEVDAEPRDVVQAVLDRHLAAASSPPSEDGGPVFECVKCERRVTVADLVAAHLTECTHHDGCPTPFRVVEAGTASPSSTDGDGRELVDHKLREAHERIGGDGTIDRLVAEFVEGDGPEAIIVAALRRSAAALGAARIAFEKLEAGAETTPLHLLAGDAKRAEDLARDALTRYDRVRELPAGGAGASAGIAEWLRHRESARTVLEFFREFESQMPGGEAMVAALRTVAARLPAREQQRCACNIDGDGTPIYPDGEGAPDCPFCGGSGLAVPPWATLVRARGGGVVYVELDGRRIAQVPSDMVSQVHGFEPAGESAEPGEADRKRWAMEAQHDRLGEGARS